MEDRLFVPPAEVVKYCTLVCKRWLAICTSQTLWRRMCEEEKKFVPRVMGPPPDNFMVFYFKHPYSRNLLRNTQAMNGTKFWKSWTKSEWSRMVQVEDKPAGSNAIQDDIPENLIQGAVKNWVTSYQLGVLQQEIDLMKEGCSTVVLDELMPAIHVSAWCSARWDCGSKFNLKVKLMNQSGDDLDIFEREFDMSEGHLRKVWHKIEHTFIDYKPGVRKILFYMAGVDTQFWAGNYGSKITLPCVRFVFD